MGWYSPAVPVSHRGSPLLRGHLCRQADVGDGWRREKGDLNAPQLPEPLLEYLSWGNMASSCRCRWCRGSAPAGSGLGYLSAQHVALCILPAGERRLSLPCGWSQPGPFRDAGCWLGAVPGLMALPLARSAFESPCPEPGSGAGEDGQITSSWSRLPPHVVCLVGHCKPRASGHALPFSPLPESSAGAAVEPDRTRAFGVAHHLAQGIPRPAPGCCAVLRCMWVPGGDPLPTAAQGAVGGRACPPALAKLPRVLPRAPERAGKYGSWGHRSPWGRGAEAGGEHGV